MVEAVEKDLLFADPPSAPDGIGDDSFERRVDLWRDVDTFSFPVSGHLGLIQV